jgi:hypothetical protein
MGDVDGPLCSLDPEHGFMVEVVSGKFWACPICDGSYSPEAAESLTAMFDRLTGSDRIGVVAGVPPDFLSKGTLDAVSIRRKP